MRPWGRPRRVDGGIDLSKEFAEAEKLAMIM
jgi:hypothetical protein